MSEMGREPAEALESAATGGGLESSVIEAGEAGPAEPALDIVGSDLGSGGLSGGGRGDGLGLESGEAGPGEPGEGLAEPGEAGPADALEGGVSRGFQEAGETAEKGIESAGKDAESVGPGIGRDAAQAISAIEAAGEALADKGAEASHPADQAGQAGLGHAAPGREGGEGGSVVEHGVRPGPDRGTGQGTSELSTPLGRGPGDSGPPAARPGAHAEAPQHQDNQRASDSRREQPGARERMEER